MALSPSMNRSTRGASKQRRDLINMEIERLKDLLPLSETIRQRLFQLQVMSLVCIYIRKERYLPHSISNSVFGHGFHSSCYNFGNGDDDYDVCKALRGFLIMVTRQGKLLYLSENASDYLAHSVEEIMSQGDSLYDLVDQRDHGTVQAELMSGPPSLAMNMPFPDERVFMCRMNLSRAARRHLQYHKFILMHGRYLHPAEYYQALMTFIGPGGLIHPVFASFCTPLITPENAELLAAGNTMVFCTLHNMDMKFLQVDEVAVYQLGYSSEELAETSWYRLIHPSDIVEASAKHKLLCEEKETCCILLVRIQNVTGQYLWLHTVLALKEGVRNENVEQLILATYQMLSDIEAATLQANNWIYNTPQRLQDQAFLAFGLRPADLAFPNETVLLTNLDDDTIDNQALVKAKRKYSRSKPKSTSSSSRLSQCLSRNEPPPPPIVSPMCNQNLSSCGVSNPMLGFHGLSPPTPESTDGETRAIMVEIPGPVSHIIGLSSMLTPETSPANGGMLSSNCLARGKPPNVDCGPSLVDVNRLLESPLPVIEPSALEAYLHHVESEGCIPVFGFRSELSLNKQVDQCQWAQTNKQLDEICHSPLEPLNVQRTFSDDASVIPQSITPWHRSASWCSTTAPGDVSRNNVNNNALRVPYINRMNSHCNSNVNNRNNVMSNVDQQKQSGRV